MGKVKIFFSSTTHEWNKSSCLQSGTLLLYHLQKSGRGALFRGTIRVQRRNFLVSSTSSNCKWVMVYILRVREKTERQFIHNHWRWKSQKNRHYTKNVINEAIVVKFCVDIFLLNAWLLIAVSYFRLTKFNTWLE